MTLIAIAVSSVLLNPLSAEPCPQFTSIYRDGDGQGFELVWEPDESRTVTPQTALKILHEDAVLYEFSITQASGYGSVFVVPTVAEVEAGAARQNLLTLHFFNDTLSSAQPMSLTRDVNAVQYLFIAGLGSYDYYERRASPFLGETMWVFDRCQP